MMKTWLGSIDKSSVISVTGMLVNLGSTVCSCVGNVVMWLTMTIATSMSAGKFCNSRM